MKKKMIIALIVVLICALSTFIGIQYNGIPYWIEQSIEKNRKELAETLQVDLKEYSHSDSFPGVYFLNQLKPGMPITDVHKIMVGYLKVYNCYHRYGMVNKEIYYFIENDETYADKILIIYDDNLRFEEIITSSPPSQTVGGHACEQGQIKTP